MKKISFFVFFALLCSFHYTFAQNAISVELRNYADNGNIFSQFNTDLHRLITSAKDTERIGVFGRSKISELKSAPTFGIVGISYSPDSWIIGYVGSGVVSRNDMVSGRGLFEVFVSKDVFASQKIFYFKASIDFGRNEKPHFETRFKYNPPWLWWCGGGLYAESEAGGFFLEIIPKKIPVQVGAAGLVKNWHGAFSPSWMKTADKVALIWVKTIL